MSVETVTPDGFGKALQKLIYEESEETKLIVDEVSKTEANTVVREVKQSSAVFNKRSKKGSYKTGWRKRRDKSVSGYYMYTVYHNAPKYRLTHLLENGHAIWVWKRLPGTRSDGKQNGKAVPTGRRTSPRPHIRPVAEKSAERYFAEIKRRLTKQ